MVEFYTIGMYEKYDPFVAATAAAKYTNGVFGTVANGVFTVGADGAYVLMNRGKGDSMYTDFEVEEDEDCRVCDLTKLKGKKLRISPAHLPATFAAGNKLVSDSTGKLVVDASATGTYLTVDKTIEFDGTGALVTIVTA